MRRSETGALALALALGLARHAVLRLVVLELGVLAAIVPVWDGWCGYVKRVNNTTAWPRLSWWE